MQKIPVISKIASNKNCSEFNFLRKTQRKHISIFFSGVELGTYKDCRFWNITRRIGITNQKWSKRIYNKIWKKKTNAVFSSYLENIMSRTFISYSSYHRPIISHVPLRTKLWNLKYYFVHKNCNIYLFLRFLVNKNEFRRFTSATRPTTAFGFTRWRG